MSKTFAIGILVGRASPDVSTIISCALAESMNSLGWELGAVLTNLPRTDRRLLRDACKKATCPTVAQMRPAVWLLTPPDRAGLDRYDRYNRHLRRELVSGH